MACEDIPSLLDVQKVKLNADDFDRLMGTGTGTSTNGVTGQVRPTYNAVMANLGYTRVGTFEAGATLTTGRQTLLWDIADGGDGQEYGWSGSFPLSGKVVPTGSTPASTGSIAVGAWMSRFDPELQVQVRETQRRSYAEAGYPPAGSFENSAMVTKENQVVLFLANGNGYSWGGVLPKNVPAGSTPESTGGISADAWSQVALPSVLFEPATTASTMTLPERTIKLNAHQLRGESLVGQGANSNLKAADGAASVLRLGDSGAVDGWYLRWLKQFSVDGNGKLSDGLVYGNAGGVNDQYAGRWDISNVMIANCNIGISKPKGNIGNRYRALRVKNNNIGYKSISSPSPIMHGGCEIFEGGQFGNNALAAMIVDSAQLGSGQFTIRDTIFEANPGFALFVKNWGIGAPPITVENAWFESNATLANVTIDGVVYTPKDMRFDNTRAGIIRGSAVGKTEINGSAIKIENGFFDDATRLSYDTASAVTVRDAIIDGGVHKVLVTSIMASLRVLGGFASTFRAPARIRQSNNAVGVVVHGQTYHGEATYSFPGGMPVTGKKYPDGRIFDTCCELSIGAGGIQIGTTFNCLNNKYYVMTLDVKHIAGDLNALSMYYINSGTLCPNFKSLLRTGEWVTVACIGKAPFDFNARLHMQTTSASAQTLRISAEQVVEFANYDDAIQFYNSREYVGAALLPRVSYGSAIPTIGVWKKGDQVINSAPTAGGIYGWVCTTAGDAATTAVFKPISTIGA